MRLYGSQTSPFTRRLRLELDPKCFEFVLLDIFSGPGREELRRISPVMKIPVLVDAGTSVYDSRVIQRYCADKNLCAKLDWNEENLLTIIDGVSDSLVNTLLLKRSSIVLDSSSVLGRSHAERILESMNHLEELVEESTFSEWNFISISLYSLLDWAEFRELMSLSSYPHLQSFVARNKERPRVHETDPRIS